MGQIWVLTMTGFDEAILVMVDMAVSFGVGWLIGGWLYRRL